MFVISDCFERAYRFHVHLIARMVRLFLIIFFLFRVLVVALHIKISVVQVDCIISS